MPEEDVDNRPLYDRLKEVRDRKQAEYEEEHRFSKFYNWMLNIFDNCW